MHVLSKGFRRIDAIGRKVFLSAGPCPWANSLDGSSVINCRHLYGARVRIRHYTGRSCEFSTTSLARGPSCLCLFRYLSDVCEREARIGRRRPLVGDWGRH